MILFTIIEFPLIMKEGYKFKKVFFCKNNNIFNSLSSQALNKPEILILFASEVLDGTCKKHLVFLTWNVLEKSVLVTLRVTHLTDDLP